jgi:hypothetical protein
MTYLRMTHFLKLRGLPPSAKAPQPVPEAEPAPVRKVVVTKVKRRRAVSDHPSATRAGSDA